jgi:hypothetical protein
VEPDPTGGLEIADDLNAGDVRPWRSDATPCEQRLDGASLAFGFELD